MDESGIHQGATFCVVAGYVAKVEDWKGLEKEWKRILKKASVEEFHAKRFHAGHDEYRSWNSVQRQTFLDQLLISIKRRKVFMLGSAISVADFFSYSEDQRRWLTGGQSNFLGTKWIQSGAPSKPYFLPFQHAVFAAATRCSPSEKVHFFFDLQKQYSGWAVELYNQIENSSKVSVRDHLGQLSFVDSKEAVGLQAADLVCYELARMAEDPKYTPTYIASEAGKRGASIHMYDKTGLKLVFDSLRSSFPRPDP